MSEKTLTRMDLSEAVFREVGLSRNESAQLVETVLQQMSEALVRGETVKISSFGTFSVANARSVVKVPDDVDLRLAGPLACGVQTGAGTVLDVRVMVRRTRAAEMQVTTATCMASSNHATRS